MRPSSAAVRRWKRIGRSCGWSATAVGLSLLTLWVATGRRTIAWVLPSGDYFEIDGGFAQLYMGEIARGRGSPGLHIGLHRGWWWDSCDVGYQRTARGLYLAANLLDLSVPILGLRDSDVVPRLASSQSRQGGNIVRRAATTDDRCRRDQSVRNAARAGRHGALQSDSRSGMRGVTNGASVSARSCGMRCPLEPAFPSRGAAVPA